MNELALEPAPSTLDLNNLRTQNPVTIAPPRYIFQRSEDLQDLILTIDNSSLEMFATCARAAQYKLIRSRERPTGAAINAGKCLHNALELFYKTNFNTDCLNQVVEDIQQFYVAHPTDDLEWRTMSMVIDSVMKYWHHYRDADRANFTVLETESSFRKPLCTIEFNSTIPVEASLLLGEAGNTSHVYARNIHVVWSGRVDLVFRTTDGRVRFKDHKTTTMLGPSFYDDFEFTSQTVGYYWAKKQDFPELSGFTLNVIAWRKPTKTGTPLEFVRRDYFYDDYHANEWVLDVTNQINDFLAHLVRGYFPKQTKWCVGKYGKCPYFDVCASHSDAEREFLLASDMFSNVTWTPFNHD